MKVGTGYNYACSSFFGLSNGNPLAGQLEGIGANGGMPSLFLLSNRDADRR